MNTLLHILLICLSLCSLQTKSFSSGIAFENLSLDSALEKARSTDKLIFVDAYAKWCAPCKQLDQVFMDKALGDVMNDHFINIKVDMDTPEGKLLFQDYDVVFLPTLLILSQKGEVVSRVAKLVDAFRLTSIALDALDSRGPSSFTGLQRDPFARSEASGVQQDYDPEQLEEVIYVHDERASSGRPHIMYHEAYLHLQLMDSKHHAVVKKYLSTQDDWSTDKNVRFIFDFLDDTRSELFVFFRKNRARFEEVVGKEKVAKSLSYLIHQRIKQGYPRPNLEEAIQLYSYLDPKTAEINAHKYNLMLHENDHDAYLPLLQAYLEDINPNDHQLVHTYVSLKMLHPDGEDHLNALLKMMELANSLDVKNSEYLFTTAQLYMANEEYNTAKEYALESLEIAQLNGEEDHKHKRLLALLEDL